MESLIEGAYDLHVHSAPDVLPRLMDDIEMAQRIVSAKMAGYVIKNHYFCTADRAALMRKQFPQCRVYGSVTLNSSVGGINPSAVEMAGRAGAKLVWFPTCDSENERQHVFKNHAEGKKVPYWANILFQMKDEGIEAPTVDFFADGNLAPEVNAVLGIIKKYRMVLCTSHIGHEECFALIRRAASLGVEKMIVTHADFPTTFYSVDQQKELVKSGAYIEHCYTTWATGKVDFAVSVAQIRAIGPERVIISTDLGQKTAVYPDQGMQIYAEKLVEAGFSKADVRKMTVDNPSYLIS